MSVSRRKLDQVSLVVEALKAIDTATLQRVADEVGLEERTLWRYRKGETRPTKTKARLLARALGLSGSR